MTDPERFNSTAHLFNLEGQKVDGTWVMLFCNHDGMQVNAWLNGFIEGVLHFPGEEDYEDFRVVPPLPLDQQPGRHTEVERPKARMVDGVAKKGRKSSSKARERHSSTPPKRQRVRRRS